ncbi:pyrroline-5-carboxylate reductase [Kordiimonas sp. SCSIO 12603]|uniref:pyrroline-5-carboxylate reductase n=1 Tax=Kordiimonas sp. SCSIO 12603 TaxID=2829596 RepID=UPI002107C557|nr:pyrroline-5-carboxylate reductase [Kordiimonas sp. SCSIO 12603]UTW60120.1 pyrroline-5-carboxylate reductase [Kordiimonas sp. SCSIO 12603]
MQHVFSPDNPLILVGCGHMGHAMALGWLSAGVSPEAIFVIDPALDSACLPGVATKRCVTSFEELPKGTLAKAVVLAVKPQVIDRVLPQVAGVVDKNSLVISVAAGVTLDQMQRGIEHECVLIRSMPNTPAAVGAGITGLTAREGIAAADKTLARELLSATGATVWIDSEDQMNAVTAVSGSGPAYVFYMVECMAAAGVRQGLPEDVAMALARQTIIGAGRLLAADSDIEAAELRRRVTSPGGTTAAALNVLMQEEGLPDLMLKAIEAANKRGAELAG